MYVVTGNDDVFALNAKTGEILWERWSGIDQKISTRLLRLAQPRPGDGRGDAVPRPARRQCRRARHQDRQGGVEDADRGLAERLRHHQRAALLRRHRLQRHHRRRIWRARPADGARRQDRQDPVALAIRCLRRARSAATPGRPAPTTAMRGGASIWNTPALDPELGLVYFATGNCGPDYDGSMREGDNLFCASIVALNAKTGEYAWHFQEVHHDIWDYDAASPVVLFDTVINGQPRKGIAEAGRTGWVYILDRTNGKPLVGIEERPVPQEPRQKTAKTQPYPDRRRDRAAMRRSRWRATKRPAASSRRSGTSRSWSSRRAGRHELVADAVQSGYRASSTCPGTIRTSAFVALPATVQEWAALYRRHPGGADRLADERHLHRDRRQDQQDRLAATRCRIAWAAAAARP